MSENDSKSDIGTSALDASARLVHRAKGLRDRLGPGRPLMVEMTGTVASGKTSAQQNLRALFRRTGFRVSAPREGAEAIEGPRPLPAYNFRTFEYAMLEAHRLFHSGDFDIALFDRALYDGVVRMDFYRVEGVITAKDHATAERYMLMPHNVGLFDLHLFLVCDPEITLKRKAADELIHLPGKTVNPDSLRRLYETHRSVWERLKLDGDPRFVWVDTDGLDKREVVRVIAEAVMDALEHKLVQEGG